MPEMRKFFECITEDLFNFNILLIPFAFLMGAMSGRLYEPLTLLLFIPLLLYFYFLRIKIKKLSVFLFLTWITCLIGLLTSHKILYTAFIAFLCSHSVRQRTSESAKLRISFELLCFPLVFLAAFYIFADYLRIPQMRGFIYCQALAVFILSILYVHLKGINNELELASATSLQSTKVITAFAGKYLFVYIAGFMIVLLLFRFVPFGRLAVLIGHYIVTALRFLISLIPSHPDNTIGTPLSAPVQEPADLTVDELPRWLEIIEQILIYTVNIIVLIIILIFIALFFLRLYRGFYSHKEAKIIYKDGSSRVTVLERTPKRRFAAKIENPVRRKYYRCVNKYFKKHKLSKADTPEEIRIKLSGKENLDNLTVIYEQARYDK